MVSSILLLHINETDVYYRGHGEIKKKKNELDLRDTDSASRGTY